MSDSGIHPTQLSKDAQNRALVIHWSDGKVQQVRYRDLRDACPCAFCSDKRMKESEQKQTGTLNILSAAELQPLEILKMSPVGNYAYSIQFSDGHSSGIFSFGFLRDLSPEHDLSSESNNGKS